MSKNYSLKQCKEDMILMWEWLVEHDGKNKSDFILESGEYDIERFEAENMLNSCPCCKFVGRGFLDILNCHLCPIQWNKEQPNQHCACECSGSPYKNWCHQNYNWPFAWTILQLAKAI